jgi:hypothetical protein
MISTHPPMVATWFLKQLGSGPNNDALLGDLIEEYGQGRSRIWYWRQVLIAIVVSFCKEIGAHWLLCIEGRSNRLGCHLPISIAVSRVRGGPIDRTQRDAPSRTWIHLRNDFPSLLVRYIYPRFSGCRLAGRPAASPPSSRDGPGVCRFQSTYLCSAFPHLQHARGNQSRVSTLRRR